MARTILSFPYVADQSTLQRTTGGKVDWANTDASYVDAETGMKVIPAGTIMSKIGPQQFVPRIDDTPIDNATEEAYIIESDAYENDPQDNFANYGMLVGGLLYEILLPQYQTAPNAVASLDGYKGFLLDSYFDSRG